MSQDPLRVDRRNEAAAGLLIAEGDQGYYCEACALSGVLFQRADPDEAEWHVLTKHPDLVRWVRMVVSQVLLPVRINSPFSGAFKKGTAFLWRDGQGRLVPAFVVWVENVQEGEDETPPPAMVRFLSGGHFYILEEDRLRQNAFAF